MTKKELRKLYKEKRIQLTLDEINLMNTQLLHHLKTMNWKDVRFVHVFLSMAKFKEPDTLVFIDWLRETYPHITLVISKSDLEKGEMTNYIFDEKVVLETNNWGITEPSSGTMIENDEIDVVIVPLLVVDKEGNRVGYGKGFYDRFLSSCRSDIKTIGLSFFDLVDEIKDVDSWDCPLDFCITPNQVYQFNKKHL